MPDTTTSRTATNASAGTDRSGSATPHTVRSTTTTSRPAGGPGGGGGTRAGASRSRSTGPTGGNRPGGAPTRAPGAGRPGSAPPAARPSGTTGRPSNGRNGGTAGRGQGASSNGQKAAVAAAKPTGPIAIGPQIMVKDLADLLDVSVNEVIRNLISAGIFASINQVVSYDAAAKVAIALGLEPEEAQAAAPPTVVRPEAALIGAKRNEAGRMPRPPVVTVMGHVDHGKTSLLDTIRNTRVAAGEAGGITQHIGAYQVEINGRKVTFLDTPGHEAFTAMRARGAQVTDIAVIVVAADDGVMPQTIEAIDHARAAQVPIIIALNKIDKPGANGDKVKQQLADHGVVIEEFGGDVICVPVSAKKNVGIEDLLEMILLVADVEDLKANPNGPAQGTIIEARLDRNSGVTANALIQEGTLKLGDIIVVGTISGKVRAMFDDTGKRIKKALPSTPVSILGLSEVPAAGDHLEVLADERSARTLVEQRRSAAHAATLANITLDTLYIQMQEGKVKELNLLVKADVQGSVEAIKHALSRAGDENLKVRLIHDGVGNVSETDVHLAAASKAIIIAFNVKIDGPAQRVAANDGVDIRSYSVIYKLMDDIDAALKGLLEPEYREQVDGHADVMQTFKSGRRIIAGCRVTDGKLSRGSQVRIIRNSKVIHTGIVESLRRGKDDAREVLQGFECGVLVEDFNDFQVADIVETFSMVRV
ncbi:MAG: translation initiation factor IF-2 [Chloroflexi bacterium]|nr:MAG: translation initiation factor IF-2 [Chloroflexota bacterium]